MTAVGDRVARLVDAAVRRHDHLAVGITSDGEHSFLGHPSATSALFEIGSVTKVFTGVLLADMVLAGEVQLGDPVTTFLPSHRLPHWRGRPPTLEELATHRAALPNAPRGLGRKEMALALGLRSTDPWADVDTRTYRELVHRTRAARPPGGRFAYSSLAFGLLGEALAARAGQPYQRLLHDRICAPLGLADTAVSLATGNRPRLLAGQSRRGKPRPPLRDHMPAAGGIRSSSRDLITFLAATLDPPSTAPGPALRVALEPRVEVNRRMSMGLGWMTARRKGHPDLSWHNGGTWGFRSFVGLLPDHRVAVVVLTNTARSVDRLGLRIIDSLAE